MRKEAQESQEKEDKVNAIKENLTRRGRTEVEAEDEAREIVYGK